MIFGYLKKSERPVDALAVKIRKTLMTHSVTDNFKSRDASASKNCPILTSPFVSLCSIFVNIKTSFGVLRISRKSCRRRIENGKEGPKEDEGAEEEVARGGEGGDCGDTDGQVRQGGGRGKITLRLPKMAQKERDKDINTDRKTLTTRKQ